MPAHSLANKAVWMTGSKRIGQQVARALKVRSGRFRLACHWSTQTRISSRSLIGPRLGKSTPAFCRTSSPRELLPI